MPAIVRRLQKRGVDFERVEAAEDGSMSIHIYKDSNGMEYRIGAGLLIFDNYIIDTARLMGATPTSGGRGIKLHIEGVNDSTYFTSTKYDIDAIQDLIIVAKEMHERSRSLS